MPIGATLRLPAEREGWYGELQLLALARTGTEAAITVATRWAGQTRRSATPRPRHAPFHEVAAVDDRGVSYRAALWDMGIEDGREWWDCHLGLTPAPPDGVRWLDIGPGARGRYVRVELAAPDWADGIATQPVEPAAPAARLLDRAGDELLAAGPASRAAGLSLAARVALLITDLTGSGVLAADDPAVARLLGLGWRLGVDLGLAPGGQVPRAALPETWHSMLADGAAADGPVGAAAFAANLPEIGGAWFSLAGLRSARDGATLHVMASGWTPHGNGWVVHGLGPHSDPGQVALTWRARDSAGRWHLVSGMHWGSQQGMIQMQLVPALHPAATSLDVIVSDGRRQVSATVPLDWLPWGAPGERAVVGGAAPGGEPDQLRHRAAPDALGGRRADRGRPSRRRRRAGAGRPGRRQVRVRRPGRGVGRARRGPGCAGARPALPADQLAVTWDLVRSLRSMISPQPGQPRPAPGRASGRGGSPGGSGPGRCRCARCHRRCAGPRPAGPS